MNRLKEALSDTQERLGFVLESIKDYALMLLDVNGTVTGWSAGAEKILGFKEMEILGEKIHRIFTPEDVAAGIPEREMERSMSEGRATDDRWHLRKDGTRFWASGYMRPLFLFEGQKQLRGFAKLIRELTESKLAEERIKELNKSTEAWAAEMERRVKEGTEELLRTQNALHQAEKLEAIGRLAGGVAHDFNNLMTGILGITEELQKNFEPASPYQEDLADILNAARKATAITKQLLAFGRRQVVDPQILDLNQVISSMDGLFQRLLGENIDVKTVLRPDLGFVSLDPGNMEQVVINLGLNGRDAMPQGGELRIETANVELGSGTPEKDLEVLPGAYVVLTVADSGGGMTQQTMDHMFEPFFTTKEGKGTGLGLANVYGIVKKAKGKITVESHLGKGTVFKVYLPRVEASLQPQRPVSDRRAASSGNETILVTEDEDIVRKVVARALRSKGYTVLHARDAKAAIAISEHHPQPIHLLLTDLVMPGLNGHELAKEVAKTHPETAVLYMSGYTQDIIGHSGILDPGTNFIEKTFRPEALCNKVRDVLDEAKKKAERSST